MENKYRIDTEENRAFMRSLAEDLLRFGHQFPSPEGSAYYLGDDGTPWKDRPRETFITCRMAHVYSLGKMLSWPGSDELIKAALKGLFGELTDREHGGWYSAVAADGTPLPLKQCYTHAFVILAASSACIAEVEGAKQLLDEALQVYDRYFWDEDEGLARDTWNTEFTVPDKYRGLNANMHSVEAFLAAADALGEEAYRARCHRMIDRVIAWAEMENWRIPEHYSEEWVPLLEMNRDRPADQFKPYGATPGHGMEWSRLIAQWAWSTYGDGDVLESDYIMASEHLYRRAVEDGWSADGAPGFVYTTDWNGGPVVHDRMHWVLAEAINTAAVLYRITGKEEYAEDYARFLQYLDEKVVDHEHGSWFHQMDSQNHVIGTVWPGKNDLYHAFQAALIPYFSESSSIAWAVKQNLPETTHAWSHYYAE